MKVKKNIIVEKITIVVDGNGDGSFALEAHGKKGKIEALESKGFSQGGNQLPLIGYMKEKEKWDSWDGLSWHHYQYRTKAGKKWVFVRE